MQCAQPRDRQAGPPRGGELGSAPREMTIESKLQLFASKVALTLAVSLISLQPRASPEGSGSGGTTKRTWHAAKCLQLQHPR